MLWKDIGGRGSTSAEPYTLSPVGWKDSIRDLLSEVSLKGQWQNKVSASDHWYMVGNHNRVRR